MDFTQKMKLRGKAEEDLYFAQQDSELIEALHEMQKNGEIDSWHKMPERNDEQNKQ